MKHDESITNNNLWPWVNLLGNRKDGNWVNQVFISSSWKRNKSKQNENWRKKSIRIKAEINEIEQKQPNFKKWTWSTDWNLAVWKELKKANLWQI